MRTQQPKNIDDRLLAQDRWIFGMILLSMIAIFVTIVEVDQINREVEEQEKRISLTTI